MQSVFSSLHLASDAEVAVGNLLLENILHRSIAYVGCSDKVQAEQFDLLELSTPSNNKLRFGLSIDCDLAGQPLSAHFLLFGFEVQVVQKFHHVGRKLLKLAGQLLVYLHDIELSWQATTVGHAVPEVHAEEDVLLAGELDSQFPDARLFALR